MLSTERIRRSDAFARDYEGLAGIYDEAFRDDRLLRKLSTAEDRALMFRIAIEEQLARRDGSVMERSVPSDHSLAEVLALHKIWLETEGKKGQQADLSDADSRGSGPVRSELSVGSAGARGL